MPRTGPVTKDTSTVALGLAQIRIGDALSNIASFDPVLTAADSIGALASTKYAGAVDYWKLESGFPLQEDLTIPLRESNSLETAFKEITPFNFALARGLSPLDAISAAVGLVKNNSVAGTTLGDITVTDTAGPVTDTWTVVVEAEAAGTTTYSVYGALTGQVIASLDDDTLQAPDNGGNPYFSIPSGFFDGVWVADETYVFTTTAYVMGTAAYGSAHSGSINLGTLKAPDFVRMEAVYTYPNNINTLTLIFPRANVVSSPELDLQVEDAAAISLNFESKGADSGVAGGNAVWDAAPLGRFIWA